MSKINWREHMNGSKEDLCAWLLCELTANNDELNKMLNDGDIDVENMNVTLTIEGVEVDFEWATKLMDESLDRLILEEAKKLITNKMNEFFSKLHKVENNLDELLDSVQNEVEEIWEKNE
jgi:hypothetical protein